MIWVVAFLVAGIVCAIAATFVFREAQRMSEAPPAAYFDPDDACAWVVARLPDLVAATLTPDDVRRILDCQLEFFRDRGVSVDGRTGEPPMPVVLRTAETIEYIVARCAETGEAYLPEQVEGVLETELDYLRYIGAIGRPAGPDETSQN